MSTKTKFRESITESVYSPSAKVDRANKVIRHVKILGKDSRNLREYTAGARMEAATLYEGMSVNLNHPTKEAIKRSRGIEEKWGWLEGITNEDDGVYGDLHYLDKHQYTPQLLELAERNPKQFGLSHNADCAGHRVGRKEVIESVEKVRSVDVVQRPATTSGLFESILEMDGMADFDPRAMADKATGFPGGTETDSVNPDETDSETDDDGALSDIQTIIDDAEMSADEKVAGIRAILSGASHETGAVQESCMPRGSTGRSLLESLRPDSKGFAARVRGTAARSSARHRLSLTEQLQRNEGVQSALSFHDAKSLAALVR